MAAAVAGDFERKCGLRDGRTWRFNLRSETIKLQNILQHDDAFEFVHVRAADYRQGVQAGGTHALERDGERLIGMQMGKVTDWNQFDKFVAGKAVSASFL